MNESHFRAAKERDIDRCFAIETCAYRGSQAARKDKILKRINTYSQVLLLLKRGTRSLVSSMQALVSMCNWQMMILNKCSGTTLWVTKLSLYQSLFTLTINAKVSQIHAQEFYSAYKRS